MASNAGSEILPERVTRRRLKASSNLPEESKDASSPRQSPPPPLSPHLDASPTEASATQSHGQRIESASNTNELEDLQEIMRQMTEENHQLRESLRQRGSPLPPSAASTTRRPLVPEVLDTTEVMKEGFEDAATHMSSDPDDPPPSSSSSSENESDNLASHRKIKHRHHKARALKIPDPPLLSDGEHPRFFIWKRLLKDKLLLNKKQFPTGQFRMAYVYSRTEGLAQEHLTPRYQQGLDDDCRSVEEMLTHLQECFHKPDEEATV